MIVFRFLEQVLAFLAAFFFPFDLRCVIRARERPRTSREIPYRRMQNAKGRDS